MHDPTEPDRQEILEGPNNPRPARKRGAGPETGKRTAILITAALVAIFAAGGVGFFLAGSQGKTPPAAGGTVQSTGEPSGQSQDDQPAEVSSGDDSSQEDVQADNPGDGTPQDVVADNPAAKSGQKTDKGQAGNDTETEKPAATGDKPTTGDEPAPTKQPQSADADAPMDGPPGSIPGHCAASGC